MTRATLRFFLCAAAIVCMAAVVSVHADEIVLNPIADTWLREAAPGSAYDADFVSVWARGADSVEGNNARYGVLSFDLSGVTQPIASARLELYMVSYSRNTAYPCKQDAFLVTPGIASDNGLTWSGYHAGSPTEIQLQGIGVYDLPADNVVNQFYVSTATAADVALLEAQRTGGIVSFLFKAQDSPTHEVETTVTQGRHDWGDLNTPAQAPTILVNGTPITATVDTWVREMSPAQAFENDDVSVWYSERAPDVGQRVGILEFDLSGITEAITSASMSLFSLSSSAAGEVFVQNAALLNLAGAPLTWNDYDAADTSAFEAFGHYSLAADAGLGVYLDSDAASAADLASLEALRLAGEKLVVALVAEPTDVTYTEIIADDPGSRDWADTESNYTGYGLPPASNPQIWPRLVITEVPEPGTLTLLAVGLMSLLAIRRKSAV